MKLNTAVAVPDPDPNKPAVSVFSTPQSLVTFSGATGAALALTSVIHALWPNLDVTVIGVSMSFFVEAVIYLIGFDVAAGFKNNVVGALIAIINTSVIIAAVLGIQIGGLSK
jgi:hypothetical protein